MVTAADGRGGVAMRVALPVYARVGASVGLLGAVALALAQPMVGLGALVLLGLVAMLGGLAMAKWLPRTWYGRQLEAGLRSGGITCSLALAGLVISIIVAGARSVPALAARSHVLGVDLGPVIRALGVLGWIGASVVLMLGAAVVAMGIATGAALLASWGKDRQAIEVVERAREAGQRSSRALGGGGPSVPDFYDPPGGSGLLPDPTFTWPPTNGAPTNAAPANGAAATPPAAERYAPPMPAPRAPHPSRRPSDDENWLC
jgi:hypothetical protein